MRKITHASALMSSVLASSCCVLPLLLGGVAGIAGVTSIFSTLRPIFIGIALLALGYGFYTLYVKNPKHCAPSDRCATPQGRAQQRWILWFTALVVAVFITLPYWL